MTEPAFTLLGSPVTWLELAAFALALACVAASILERVITWPLTIASSALYGWLFAASHLLAQAALQAVFAAVAVYGWWAWRRGDVQAPAATRSTALPVARLDVTGRWLALAAWLLGWAAIAALLLQTADSDAPVLEALPTAGSLLGQWLLARKCLEAWPVWVLVNVVSVALFAGQGLLLTAALYAIFAAMALAGWRRWAAQASRAPRAIV